MCEIGKLDRSVTIMKAKQGFVSWVAYAILSLIILTAKADVNVLVDLKDARLQAGPNYTNRQVRVYPMSTPTANTTSVILGNFFSGTTDSSGQCWFSNMVI